MIEIEHWDALEWVQVRKGVEHKVILAAETTLQLVRYQPGNEIRPHTHDHEQIAHVLSGVLDYYVADDRGVMVAHRMVAGSTLAIPAGTRHYGQNAGSEPVLDLDIFPVRRAEILERSVKKGGRPE
jgi:quercetin dioxygenase-like cupin family protein